MMEIESLSVRLLVFLGVCLGWLLLADRSGGGAVISANVIIIRL